MGAEVKSLVGAYGGIYSSTGTTFTALSPPALYVGAIQALGDTVITSSTGPAPGVGGVTGLSAATVPAGQIVYGRWTQVVTSSGPTVCYYLPGFA
jgi:hypothetical protein